MQKNVESLRSILFEELEALKLGTALAEGDRARIEAKLAIADRIIDTARVEVQLAAVLKGALDVPFLEGHERPDPTPRITGCDDGSEEATTVTPMDRMARTLASGPGADHPWNRDRERDRQKRA